MRTCPPPDTGRGWGPSIASYREEMTMIAMGGAGVKDVGDIRNEVPKQTISYCCLAMRYFLFTVSFNFGKMNAKKNSNVQNAMWKMML